MSHSHLNYDKVAERGEALYNERLKGKLTPNDRGKFVAIDIETGSIEIDEKDLDAIKRVRARNPNAVLYLLRVGYPSAYAMRQQN